MLNGTIWVENYPGLKFGFKLTLLLRRKYLKFNQMANLKFNKITIIQPNEFRKNFKDPT